MLLLNLSIFFFRILYTVRVFSTIYKQSNESFLFCSGMGSRNFVIADFVQALTLHELPDSFYLYSI